MGEAVTGALSSGLARGDVSRPNTDVVALVLQLSRRLRHHQTLWDRHDGRTPENPPRADFS
jgi:hypothetical protein